MKAAKINHTVGSEKPDSAQARAALAGLKPGWASCAGLYSTTGASTVAVVTPIRPIAPPGSGSSTSATMTAAKMEKKCHACGGKPAGAGSNAMRIAVAMGAPTLHQRGLGGFSMPTKKGSTAAKIHGRRAGALRELTGIPELHAPSLPIHLN